MNMKKVVIPLAIAAIVFSLSVSFSYEEHPPASTIGGTGINLDEPEACFIKDLTGNFVMAEIMKENDHLLICETTLKVTDEDFNGRNDSGQGNVGSLLACKIDGIDAKTWNLHVNKNGDAKLICRI